jgi:hypothetical protein
MKFAFSFLIPALLAHLIYSRSIFALIPRRHLLKLQVILQHLAFLGATLTLGFFFEGGTQWTRWSTLIFSFDLILVYLLGFTSREVGFRGLEDFLANAASKELDAEVVECLRVSQGLPPDPRSLGRLDLN